MTEPTPPTGRDDDFDPVPGADFDADLGLVHASIDDELTAEEEASIQPDETWRTRVSEARKAVDAVQAALPLPPVDEDRREAQLSAALAAFDELHGTAEDVAVPPPASQQHPPPEDPTPARPDELAHRRNAREWLRRAPIGIAAAVLAAVVVVGAAQLGDDGEDETASVADSMSSDDAMTEVADEADGDQTTAGAGFGMPDAESDAGATTGAPPVAQETPSLENLPQSYSMNDQPGSVDTFVDTISAMIGGDMRDVHITDDDGLALGPTCDRQQALRRLAATPDQESDLMWVRAVLDDRPVVGVIDRTDPSQVTIIDLDRCAVVAVESL